MEAKPRYWRSVSISESLVRVTTSKPIMISELIVGEQKFEVVQQFKYSGTNVTNDNNLDKEIRYRISLASNCYHGLNFYSDLNL